jgi:L-2-hydroxyglutarate oxidase LhgO
MSEEIQITIIGGGVIGCAVAYELSRDSDLEIALIERNRQINGENQSSRNSGVIHSGIYYSRKTGPLKARLCVEGNRLLYQFCREHSVPHKKTGKLVVATDKLEEEYLADIYKTALDNQVPGVKMISGRKVINYEPNVRAVSALYVPTTGIVEPTILVDRLYRIAESCGVMFLVGNEAVEIRPQGKSIKVKIKSDTGVEIFKTRLLINAAGLYSDDIARMINPASPYVMDPVGGEWGRFYRNKRDDILMNGLSVYPVSCGYLPDGERLRVGFKEFQKQLELDKVHKSTGVHLTPTFEIKENEYIVSDTVIVGPAYTRPKDREDYSPKREESYYLDMVRPFFPNLRLEDLGLHQTGIRAKLKDRYDFVIEKDPLFSNVINLVGMDSPALSASLAVAKYVKEMLGKYILE